MEEKCFICISINERPSDVIVVNVDPEGDNTPNEQIFDAVIKFVSKFIIYTDIVYRTTNCYTLLDGACGNPTTVRWRAVQMWDEQKLAKLYK